MLAGNADPYPLPDNGEIKGAEIAFSVRRREG